MLWLPEDPLPRQPQGQLEPHPYWIGRGLIFAYSGTHRAHWVRRGRFIQTAGTQVASGGAVSGKNVQISNANYQELGVSVPLTVFAVATLPTLPGAGEYPAVLTGTQYGVTDRGGIEIGVFASDNGVDNRKWYSVCRSNTYKTNETIIMGPLATAQSPTSLMYTLSASGHAFTIDGAQYSSGFFAAPGVNGVDPMSIGATPGASDMLVECLYRFSGILSTAEYEALRRNPGILWELPEEIVLLPPTGGTSASVDGTQAGTAAQSGNIVANILAAGIQIGVAAQSGSIAGAPSPAGTQSGAGAQSLGLSNASSVGGTVSAIATQSGDLFVRAEVGGAQLAAALQSLALSYGSSVGGIMSGAAAHTLDLGFGLTIGGTQIAAAIQAGGIAPDVRIAGVQIGAAANSMGLAGDAATIGGNQAAAAAQSMAITAVVRVSAQQIADAILSGSLTVDVRIGSVQGGVAQIVGDVSGAVRISATMAGSSAQSGAIQLAGELIIRWPARRLYSQQIQTTRRPRQLQCRR